EQLAVGIHAARLLARRDRVVPLLLRLEREAHVELVARIGQERVRLLERGERTCEVGRAELVLALLVERVGLRAMTLVRRRRAGVARARPGLGTGRRRRWLGGAGDARPATAGLREQ